ncbi:MAG: tRNA (N(6)-L-threonylcarbamoyladenosine(37)-C(2))-methylthiotransferase MtaB [Eubacteriales bacterium]
MLKIGIHTLGCKVSQYESAAIKEELERRGYTVTDSFTGCDIQIINTCTVTAEADRKCCSAVRRAARSGAKTLVIGCMTEIDSHDLETLDNVIYVSGTAKKMKTVEIVDRIAASLPISGPACAPADKEIFEAMSISSFDRTRAYIKVEDGCESHCSYCIIPKARGKIRSKTKEDTLEEAGRLIRGGCHEIVLTGIEVDAWGRDLGVERLPDLIEAVNALPGDFRIRLGSLDPVIVDEAFCATLSTCEKLAPHFHLSVQSGSSRTLARMRRRYNADQIYRAVSLLRAAIPGVCFTCDIIVGFPGESEEDFLETCRLAEAIGFLHMHIFPYSKRPGTPAAEMPDQISASERKRRAALLAEIAEKKKHETVLEALSGFPVCRVLTETKEETFITAHDGHFIEFRIFDCYAERGEFVDVRPFAVECGICFARPVKNL